MEIREKVFGKRHPDYAISLHNLAVLHDVLGDSARSEPLYREAMEIMLRSLELTADVQSPRPQVAMEKSMQYQLDGYLSLATQQPQFREAAYAALLRWKGIAWQPQRQRLLIDQPVLKPEFAALQSVSSQLLTLILTP